MLKRNLGAAFAGLLVLAFSGTAAAIGVISPPLPTYTYTLTLPTISAGLEVDSGFTDYAFSWVGPLRVDSPPDSACPTVCGPVVAGASVKSTESFAGFSFTAFGGDPEVNVMFSDFSGADFSQSNTVTFTFIEPDAFWATLGPQTFTTGASFAIGGNDPGCSECSVQTTAATPTATPEPRSSILIATAMAGLALVSLHRRKRQPAAR